MSSPELARIAPAKRFFSAFLSLPPPISTAEKYVSTIVAFLAMFALGAISGHFIAGGALPVLVGTMGASAVLLFAAPHSPMAQPWAFIGGHLVSAAVGITCFLLVPDLYVAAALGVALAILAMHYLRCLHPPGGGTALTVVIGGPAVHSLGYGFLLVPLGLNVVVMLLATLALNNIFPGRRYPLSHHETARKPAPEPLGWPLGKFGVSHEDLEGALKEMDAFIDVSEDDLGEIYTRAMMQSYRRRMGEIHCRDIMIRDVATAEFGTELEEVWELMRREGLKGVPVIDRARRVIGIVTIIDFLKRADTRAEGHVFERLARFIRRTPGPSSEKPEVVGQIMSKSVVTAHEEAHIVSLIPLFSQHGIHHVPVVDREERLVGMVTQSELMTALYSYRVSVN